MIELNNLNNQSNGKALSHSIKVRRHPLTTFKMGFNKSSKSLRDSKEVVLIQGSILAIKNSKNIIENDRQQIVNLVHKLDNEQLIELYELLNLKSRDFNSIKEEKEKEKGQLSQKDISEISALADGNLETLVKLIYTNPEKALMRYDKIPSNSSALLNMTHSALEKLVFGKVIEAENNEIKLASAIIEQKRKNFSNAPIGLLNKCIYDCKVASQILGFRGSIDANKSIISFFTQKTNEVAQRNPKFKGIVYASSKTLRADNENGYKEAVEWLEKYKHNIETRSNISKRIKSGLVSKMQVLKQDIIGILEGELTGIVDLKKQNAIKKKIGNAFRPIILDFVKQEIETYDIPKKEKEKILKSYIINYDNVFENVIGEVIDLNKFKNNRNVKESLSHLKQA